MVGVGEWPGIGQCVYIVRLITRKKCTVECTILNAFTDRIASGRILLWKLKITHSPITVPSNRSNHADLNPFLLRIESGTGIDNGEPSRSRRGGGDNVVV